MEIFTEVLLCTKGMIFREELIYTEVVCTGGMIS